jgi:hypothetical protein
VRPFALWPHVEVCTHDWSPKFFTVFKGSPYRKYSRADIALLEDPAKRQLYIEAHTSCIAPRYRDVAAILATKSALIEQPPPSYLDGVYPADGVDWTKFSSGTLSFHMSDMAAFAHAWAPLERRWEAEGAPSLIHPSALCNPWRGSWLADVSTQLADFSRMQPNQPNPYILMMVLMIFTKMISAAGAKETELQGASSVVRVKDLIKELNPKDVGLSLPQSET